MDDDGFVQLEGDDFGNEAAVESWLTKDPGVTVGGIDLLVVHQQGVTAEGQIYDVIGLDKKGNTVTIELKHARSPRKMVAQALEYAADQHQWEQPYATLERRYQKYTGQSQSLRQAHAGYFGLDNPRPEGAFNTDQRVILFAGRFSDRALNVAQYLRDNGHDIRCVKYDAYSGDESRIMATQTMLTEKTVETTSSASGKPSPNKRFRTPTYRRIVSEIEEEVVDELGDGTVDDPSELLLRPIDELNSLSLVSRHPKINSGHVDPNDDPFAFGLKILPTKGKLSIRVQRRGDEAAENLLREHQDEVEHPFEYTGNKYNTIAKTVDIDDVVSEINWDNASPQEIADVLLGSEEIHQYIEDYVDAIQRWHPRFVDGYPQKVNEINSE